MQQHSAMMEITMHNVNNDLAIIHRTSSPNKHATGLDDVLIDQDNNIAVSQDLTANNDCNATA